MLTPHAIFHFMLTANAFKMSETMMHAGRTVPTNAMLQQIVFLISGNASGNKLALNNHVDGFQMFSLIEEMEMM